MGDGYSSPIVGGLGTLIRDNIRSRNYVPGTSGWAIFANGLAEFFGVIIRGTLESSNYVPGVSGWHLDDSGSAELNDVTARGAFRTGNSGARIEMYDDIADGPRILLYSGDADESAPAALQAAPNLGSGPPEFIISGTEVAGAGPGIIMRPADPSNTVPGLAEVEIDAEGVLLLPPTTGLYSEAMAHQDAVDGGTRTTTSTSFVDAGTVAEVTFRYPRSGAVTVTVSGRLFNSTGASADAALMSFEIRDDDASGTLRFAATDNSSAILRRETIPFPASRTRVADGLPTDGFGYARAMLRSNNGANTASMQQVDLTVQPSP